MTYGVSLADWDRMGVLDRELTYYKGMLARGVRLGILTYGDESDLAYASRIPGAEIIPVYAGCAKPLGRFGRLVSSLGIARRLRKRLQSFEVVKTNQMLGAWVAAQISRKTGAFLVLRCGYEYYFTVVQQRRPVWIRAAVFAFSRWAYRRAHQVVVTTPVIAEQICHRFGITRSKVSVLPNFIDLKMFRPSQAPGEARGVYVGRLSEEKNLEALIEATAKARVGLDFIGDGPLGEDLRQLATRVQADVRWLGRLPNEVIAQKLPGYFFLVLVSRYEGNPKVVLEALSCGLPVIGSNVVGIRELVSPAGGEALGLLTDGSVSDLARAMGELMANPKLRAEMGARARAYAERSFGVQAVLDREFALIQELKEGRTRAVNG